jgi:hypothetical protein
MKHTGEKEKTSHGQPSFRQMSNDRANIYRANGAIAQRTNTNSHHRARRDRLSSPGVSETGAGRNVDRQRRSWRVDCGRGRAACDLRAEGARRPHFGIYCSDCANPDEVAFLQDGKVEAGGIAFRALHVAGPGAPYSEMVRGRLENGRLVLTSSRERAPHAHALMRVSNGFVRGQCGSDSLSPLPAVPLRKRSIVVASLSACLR